MLLRIDNLSNLTKNQLIKPTPSQSSIYVFNKLISFMGLLNVHKVSEKNVPKETRKREVSAKLFCELLSCKMKEHRWQIKMNVKAVPAIERTESE